MNYIIIENIKDLINVKLKKCLLFIVPETFKDHPVNYKISIVFLKDVESENVYIIPINHSDYISNITVEEILVFLSRITIISLDSKKDYHTIGIYPSIDINIISYISTLEILDVTSIYTNKYHNFYSNTFKNLNCPNCFIPSNFFIELFDTIIKFSTLILNKYQSEITTKAYIGTFGINKILSSIESAGIYIDESVFKECFDSKLHFNVKEGKLYSEYSLFTATGRPSNKFGGINFAALSKKNDTRKSIVSRFGHNGILFDIDFQACHPHLIAKLTGYNISKDLNIYEYLGRYYFNKEILTDDEIEKSKTITFRQLYGHVDSKFKDMPYFQKKTEYSNRMMEFYKEYGFIYTPVFERKMDTKNFGEESPEKMFAYLLQSYETEINLIKAKKIIEILSNFKSKVILYTYDSFLIDFSKNDPWSLIINIKNELENDGMPVSIKAGNNYKDLKKITI